MIDFAWVFFTILLFACIPLSGWIAERRGRSIKFWCLRIPMMSPRHTEMMSPAVTNDLAHHSDSKPLTVRE
jgi:hypothetical protein